MKLAFPAAAVITTCCARSAFAAAAFSSSSRSPALFRPSSAFSRRSSSSPSLSTGATLLRRMTSSSVPSSASSASAAAAAADTSASLDLGLYARTPLLKSIPLTEIAGRSVYVKLDCLQSSGSFKDRGMAHLCLTLRSTRGTTRLVSSSGGNAGLAVATVGGELGMEVQVVVPATTKGLVVDKLRALGADVTVHGANWNEADKLARERAEKDDDAEYVSPYDHPLLWTGHSTVVDELVSDMKERNETMGAVIASVGGGGLICGIFEGLERHDLQSSGTIVIASETRGAASFGKSFLYEEEGEGGGGGTTTKTTTKKPIRLDSIDSVATSLGALEVTGASLVRAARHEEGGGIVRSSVCTDAEAIEACARFAEDHRILVEPACGAALATVYSDRLREEALGDMDDGSGNGKGGGGAVVVEVCGGSGVSVELLDAWKKQFLAE